MTARQPSSNVKITVEFGGKSQSFELDGDELQDAINGASGETCYQYHGNATKDHVADQVEQAVVALTGKISHRDYRKALFAQTDAALAESTAKQTEES